MGDSLTELSSIQLCKVSPQIPTDKSKMLFTSATSPAYVFIRAPTVKIHLKLLNFDTQDACPFHWLQCHIQCYAFIWAYTAAGDISRW